MVFANLKKNENKIRASIETTAVRSVTSAPDKASSSMTVSMTLLVEDSNMLPVTSGFCNCNSWLSW